MTVKELEWLLAYDDWANRRLFEVIGRLSDDEFVKPVAGSYGSIRNTLVHMLSAEWSWLERFGGGHRGPALEPTDYPTAASVRNQWDQVGRQLRQWLSGLRDEDLGRLVDWGPSTGPKRSTSLGVLLQHVVVHGVHHRGQVALLLRELGHPPGNVDLVLYDEAAKPGVVS